MPGTIEEEEITFDTATANIGQAQGTDKNSSRSSLLSKSGHPLDVSRHISSHDNKKPLVFDENDESATDDLAMQDSFAQVGGSSRRPLTIHQGGLEEDESSEFKVEQQGEKSPAPEE
jgi:hypothetical protein